MRILQERKRFRLVNRVHAVGQSRDTLHIPFAGTRLVTLSFNGQDSDDFFQLYVYHTATKTAPRLFRYEDGTSKAYPTTTRTSANMSEPGDSDPLWVRVMLDPENGSGEHVHVRCASTQAEIWGR